MPQRDARPLIPPRGSTRVLHGVTPCTRVLPRGDTLLGITAPCALAVLEGWGLLRGRTT